MAVKGSLKRKLSSDSEKSNRSCPDLPWIEKFAPETLDELAVHKKKISEVEAWLHNHMQQDGPYKEAPILLLTGPPGSGKTAAIKTICKTLNAELFIWSNSTQNISSKPAFASDFFAIKGDWLGKENQVSEFRSFLLRSTKYSLISSSRRVILVEEFPNTFLLDSSSFHSIIRKYSVSGKCCVVFIISDNSKSESIENRLFPKELRMALNISNICFNPVAPMIMMKVLSRINNAAKVKLSKIELEDIISDSMGDIRNAINCLQFQYSSKIHRPKSLLQKGQKSASTSSQDDSQNNKRDNSLFLFHSLGKVLYCKRDPSAKSESDFLPTHMKYLERDPLLANAEDVYEKTSISADSFALFLHENYMAFVEQPKVAEKCALWISEGDILSSYWSGQDIMSNYLASIVSRGLMFNFTPSISVKRWRPLHKPQFYQNFKKRTSAVRALKMAFKGKSMSLQELQIDLVPFLSKLPKQNFIPQQTAVIRELGEMQVKRVPRPEFQTLDEKDTFHLDENDCDTADILCGTDSSPNKNFEISDEEIIIEEYDF